MLIGHSRVGLSYSAVTPRAAYMGRRRLLAAAAGALLPGSAAPFSAPAAKSPFSTNENQTPMKDVTTYNNFYEFGTGKDQPARNAHTLRTTPWTVRIEGAVPKPFTLDFDQVMKLAPLEERIYRFRCVEGWSMVVPWIGIPLAALIRRAAPLGQARYVAFESLYDSRQMPLASRAGIPFPYVEGLRLDEALHPLTILAVGLYGEALPNQNGAPLRLIVPWKYGFKGIKSIVRLRFVANQPPTTWNIANAREYGFYSNVNPEVDHPRWSQARERRLGEVFKRETLKFNGYAEHVAALYSGMDLRRDF